MNNVFHLSPVGRANRLPRGFSLVEVTLAVAVVAIGLLGILALFPLGMDAVRRADDATQMMAIGQDNLAYFQQAAASSNCYAIIAPGVIDYTKVIDPNSGNGSYSTNLSVDGIWYRVDAVVTNSGYSTIWAGIPPTNMISRVQISVYRVAGSTGLTGITSTNYYITEVARYVQ